MKKTIVFEDWVKPAPRSRARSRFRFILDRFDLPRLKRGKRAPARARLNGKKRPARGRG